MLKKMQREKRLRSQTKEVVVNIYDYFNEVKRHHSTQEPLKQTTDTTGVSCASIKKLWQGKFDTSGAAFSTLTKSTDTVNSPKIEQT